MTEIRIADAEREVVVEQLRRAAGEGRLDTDELEERVEAALRSRTDAELARVTADLPSERRGRRRRREAGRLREHRLAFAVAAPGMIGIWAFTGADYFWPIWPILGWGSGLYCNGRRRRGRTVAA
jgi:hypothetical protein